MTTAADILKDALGKMGADAWEFNEPIVGEENWVYVEGYMFDGQSFDIPEYARPAWRDGDGWFVLPDGWEWDGYNFRVADMPNLVVEGVVGNRWVVWLGINSLGVYKSAQGAFRAAQAWIDSQQTSEDK